MPKIPLTYVPVDQHSRMAHWTSKVNQHISQQIHDAINGQKGRQIEVFGFLNQKSKNIWEISAQDNLFPCKCSILPGLIAKINKGAFVRLTGKVDYLKTDEKVILANSVNEEEYARYISENFTSPVTVLEELDSVFGNSEKIKNVFRGEILKGAYQDNVSDALLHLLLGAPVYTDPKLHRTGGVFVSLFPNMESGFGLKSIYTLLQAFSPFRMDIVGSSRVPAKIKSISALPNTDYQNIYADLQKDSANPHKTKFTNFLQDNRPLGKYYSEKNIGSTIVGDSPTNPGIDQLTTHTEIPLLVSKLDAIPQKEVIRRFDPDFLGFVEYHQLFSPSYSQEQQDWLVDTWQKDVAGFRELNEKDWLCKLNVHDNPLNVLQLARSMARIEKKECIEDKHIKDAIQLSLTSLKILGNFSSPSFKPEGAKDEHKRILAYIKKNRQMTRDELLKAFSSMNPIDIDASLEWLKLNGYIYELRLNVFVAA